MRTAILASGMTLGLLSFASAMPAAFPFPPPPGRFRYMDAIHITPMT